VKTTATDAPPGILPKGLKSVLLVVLKIVGTGFFLWWVWSTIENKELLGRSFRQLLASPGWLVLGLLLALFSQLAAAWSWRILLRAQGIEESFRYLFRVTLYGALFSLVALGAAGADAAKMFCLMRRRREQKVEIGLSVAADHMCGFFATALIFLTAASGSGAIAGAKGELGRQIFIGATGFLVGGLFVILLSFFSCTPRMRAWCEHKFPRFAARAWVLKTFATINLYRQQWRQVAKAVVVSVLLSGSYFLVFFVGLAALGVRSGIGEILTVMPIVDVAAALPISLSGIGVRERTFEYLMSQLTGLPSEVTVAASLLGFCFHAFWGLVGGVLLLSERRRTRQS
jgi:uncharacterized membrane protein YbhN (UPF0104 family)